MEKLLNYLKENKIIILILFGFLGFIVWNLHSSNKAKNENVKIEHSVVKKEAVKENKSSNHKFVAVDIQGEVQKPGVYQLKDKSLVKEAIDYAGGLTEGADTKQVNQAQRVTDQMKIFIPKKGESTTNPSGNNDQSQKKVNINTAKVEDFKEVTGIGPKKAEKIIAFREKNGNFESLKDLTKVSGIGDKSLDSLKDQLTV